MTQLVLAVPVPAPAQRHSETSREAARSIESSMPQLEQRVLDFLTTWGPHTDETAAKALGMRDNTYRPRRVWLYKRGLVEASGQVVGESGRKATTWRAL